MTAMSIVAVVAPRTSKIIKNGLVGSWKKRKFAKKWYIKFCV